MKVTEAEKCKALQGCSGHSYLQQDIHNQQQKAKQNCGKDKLYSPRFKKCVDLPPNPKRKNATAAAHAIATTITKKPVKVPDKVKG